MLLLILIAITYLLYTKFLLGINTDIIEAFYYNRSGVVSYRQIKVQYTVYMKNVQYTVYIKKRIFHISLLAWIPQTYCEAVTIINIILY